MVGVFVYLKNGESHCFLVGNDNKKEVRDNIDSMIYAQEFLELANSNNDDYFICRTNSIDVVLVADVVEKNAVS